MGKEGALLLVLLMILPGAAALGCKITDFPTMKTKVFTCKDNIAANLLFNNTGEDAGYDLHWKVNGPGGDMVTEKRESGNTLPSGSDVTWEITAIPPEGAWPVAGFYSFVYQLDYWCGSQQRSLEGSLIAFSNCSEARQPTARGGLIAAGPAEITVTEGDAVKLEVEAVDPDNDKVTLTFSAPLDSNGRWKTKIGDAGTYKAIVTASDGAATTKQEVTIIVKRANRAPVVVAPDTITVKEGEMLEINASGYDPDDDAVKLSYSGFVRKRFYATGKGDAGTFTETVSVSDGRLSASKDITIKILHVNAAPELRIRDSYTVLEGSQLNIALNAVDPDGDKLRYTATLKSGMVLDSNVFTYMPPYNTTSQGLVREQAVSFTVSDESATVKKDVIIYVMDKNQKPKITNASSATSVEVGKAMGFGVTAYDPDGDALRYRWILSPLESYNADNTFTRQFTSEGRKHVAVEVSDGTDSVEYSWDVLAYSLRQVSYPAVSQSFELEETSAQYIIP